MNVKKISLLILIIVLSACKAELDFNLLSSQTELQVSVESSSVNAGNNSAFSLSGDCSHPDQEVSIAESVCNINESTTCGLDQRWSSTLNLSTCADGQLNFQIGHLDTEGNAVTIAQAIMKDVVPSAVSLSYPVEDSRVGYKLKTEGGCTTGDEDVVVLATDGVTSVQSTVVCTSNTFLTYIDMSSLAPGAISLAVSQSDSVNMMTTSRGVTKASSACDSLLDRQRDYASGLASGSGTRSDPYVICSADQLNEYRNGALTDHFVLGNDIYFESGDTNGDFTADGSDADYTSGLGWVPLPERRELNGASFSIHGLIINRPVNNRTALFSEAPGILRHLTFYDAAVIGQNYTAVVIGYGVERGLYDIKCVRCDVTGQNFVGAIVGGTGASPGSPSGSELVAIDSVVSGVSDVGGIGGEIWFSLSNSSFQGQVNASGARVGGLVGRARFPVYNSIADVTIVSTGTSTGGAVGDGLTRNVVVRGTVSGGNSVGCIGGVFAPDGDDGSVALCTSVTGVNGTVGRIRGSNQAMPRAYFASDMVCTRTSGGSCHNHGVSASRASLVDGSHAIYATNYDFRGSATDGQSELWVQTALGPDLFFTVPSNYTSPLAGLGTSVSPYILSTAQDLVEVSSNSFYAESNFRLNNSIDLSVLPAGAFKGLFSKNSFYGEFDGDGFDVLNMTLVNPRSDGLNFFTGFFGHVQGYGLVRNLHVNIASFEGRQSSGGIMGASATYSRHTLLKVSGAALIVNRYAGGIIGPFAGQLTESYASVDMNCISVGCGGLLSSIEGGNTSLLADSYATGNIVGANRAGGAVGTPAGGAVVNRIYASGNVFGTVQVGGIAGALYTAMFSSFSVGDVTGNSAISNVGLAYGLNGNAGNYVLNTAVCTNLGAGSCYSNETSSGPLSYFFDSTNAPLNAWNFATIWLENPGALPTLRNRP